MIHPATPVQTSRLTTTIATVSSVQFWISWAALCSVAVEAAVAVCRAADSAMAVETAAKATWAAARVALAELFEPSPPGGRGGGVRGKALRGNAGDEVFPDLLVPAVEVVMRRSVDPHGVPGIALGAAIDYLQEIGVDRIATYEQDLLAYATSAFARLDGVCLIGTAKEKASVLSFVVDGVHPHDVAQILDSRGIAVRAGHHCAQPLMERLGLPATARASLGMYNTKHEINALVSGLNKVNEVFA